MKKLNGRFVSIVPDVIVPKIELSSEVNVSDDFRKHIDAWLVAEFGYKVVQGVPYLAIYERDNMLFMNQATYDRCLVLL